MKCEIQIRSILQHAWAEIEHDLGYKTKLSVPKHVRRSFSRLAGLLEIADKEFISLKNELAEYEHLVSEQISQKPKFVPIDKVSLKAFISSNQDIIELDRAIAEIGKAELLPIDDEFLEIDIYILNFLKITNIAELEYLLQNNKTKILSFVKKWINGKIDSFNSGISLFYLYYILLAMTQDKDYIINALKDFSVETNVGYDELAERVLDTYDDVISNK